LLCINPGIGAITLALLFGLFNLVSGATMLINGIELRSANAKLRFLPTPDKLEKTHAAA